MPSDDWWAQFWIYIFLSRWGRGRSDRCRMLAGLLGSRKVIYTFTNYSLSQDSLDRCYRMSSTYLHSFYQYRRRQLKEGNMAFSLRSRKTTFSASTPKVFFGLEKTEFLLSCSVSCANQGSCEERKLSGEPRISYLRGGEMETNSTADRLLQPNGSFYLRKVFGINNMSRLSDNNSR